MKAERFTIFELANHTLKEIFVGMTAKGMHQVLARHRSSPASEVAHWKGGDDLHLRSVEFDLAAGPGRKFIAAHVLKIARPGWKILSGLAA